MSTTALTNPGSVDNLQAELANAKAERQAIENEIRAKLRADATGGEPYPEPEHEADRRRYDSYELRIERSSARLEAAQQAQAEAEKNGKAQLYREALAHAVDVNAAHDTLIKTLGQQADALAQTINSVLRVRGEFADARNAAYGALHAIQFRRQHLTDAEENRLIGKLPFDQAIGHRFRLICNESGEAVDHSLIPSRIDERLRANGCHALSTGRNKAGAEEMRSLERLIDHFLSS